MANEWDQFAAVSAAPATDTASEDFSQFETHKGLATNQDLVFQSLKDYGATPTTTAAILGDIQQESGYKPQLPGDRGTSHGLLQVGSPMFRQFEADQASKGIQPGSQDYVYNQAPFILNRFKQQHPDRWEAMQNADNSAEALKIFRGTPDWGYGIAGKRYQYAQNYEQALKGVPVEEVTKEVRVEKAIPVKVREMEVSRAQPVNGEAPTPPADGAKVWRQATNAQGQPYWFTDEGEYSDTPPAGAAAPPAAAGLAPAPPEDWSQFAEVKAPSDLAAATAPRAVATQPWYQRAYDMVKKGEYSKAVQQLDESGQEGIRRALNLPVHRSPTNEELQDAAKDAFSEFTSAPTGAELARPAPEERPTIGGKLMAVLENAPVDTANFMMSPAGVTSLGIGALSKGAQALISAGFGSQMLTQAIDSAREGKYQDALENLIFAGLGAHGAREAVKPEVVTPTARGLEPLVVTPQEAAAPPRPVQLTPEEAGAPAPLATAPEVAPPAAAPPAVAPAPAEAAPPPEAPAAAPEAPTAAPTEPAPAEAVAPEVAPAAAPPLPPPQAGEAPGNAWKGVAFLDQERIKGELADLGYEPQQIEDMTRSQLDATDPAREAARQAPAAPAAAGPIEDFSQFEEVTPTEAPAPAAPGEIRAAFGAKGATDVLYQKAFDALQKGETTISGVKDPILARHRAAFDRGEITSPEDLKRLEEARGRPAATQVKGFQGRGATPEQIYGPEAVAQGRAIPILGRGNYIALSKKDAAIYGKDVQPRTISIENPLVIDTNKKWSALVAEAGTPHLHSGSREFYMEPHRIPEMTERLQKFVRGQGYDGVIIKNTATEKRLRESFGHDQAVKFTKALTPEEAAAHREHEAEMIHAGKELIQAQGGMDLLEAVAHEGGLPLKGTEKAHPYRGELKMLRENIAGTKGVRYRDVFSSKSPGVDHLLLRLRARGFNIETPHELIDAIQTRIRSGTPHYAVPEAGEFLRPQEGPVRRTYPSYTTEQLREMSKTAPPEVRAKMEAEVAAREAGKAPVYKTPQIIPEAPGFKLAAPESLKEQKAREARESAQAKALAVEAEKKAKVKYGWQQGLAGTSGDLGQQELGGVVPGPEQPELFRPGAQPQTLPRQITATPAGVPTPEPGAPIAEADIRNYLSRALDIPVRAGMRVAGGMQRALGVYRVKQETIRTRLRNDIPTIAHEVGHYVHHLLFTDPSGKPSQFAASFDHELIPLGRPTSMPSYPVDRVRMEGVAEFAREWLTDRSQALAKAPQFTSFFENQLQNKFPQTWDIFQKARTDIAKFIAQPGWQKAQSKIVFDPRQPRGTFREWLSRKYTDWFNELAPIDRTMKRLTTFGLDPATAQRVSERAINYKGGWRGKADFDLEFDQTNIDGNKVGPGLKAILNGLDTKELSDFSTYLALKRAQEKGAQGIRTGFEQDLGDPEVQKQMAQLAPRYEAKRQTLIRYSDNALQLLGDSGFFTGDELARIRKANQDYVPFYRIYEDVKAAGPRGTTKSGGFVNTSSGVLRMKGSDRQIIDPLESIVKNTYAFRDLAERNRIGKEFVDAVEKTQGGGRVAESVLKPMKPSRVSHEEISAHLEKLGLDESDIKSLGPDIGMTLWRASNGIKPSEGVFRIWDKGKERLFQADDPDLLKALSLSDSSDAAAIKMLPLFKPFAAVTRMLRTGATLTPEFMARNPFRDQVTGAVFSRYGFVPFFDGFRGMLSVLGKDQYYKDWVKAGGRYSGLYDIEGPTIRKTLERVIRDPGALEQAYLALRHPLQTLGRASGTFEEATRLGEFRRAIDAGADPLTAANASKDVTLNFSRAGIKGKLVNQVLAFFNAGLQDIDKFARAHREAPVRTATKAFMYITVPSIIAWTLGKDDPLIQNLPEWRKSLFWNLNVKGTVISLPKPFLLGALYGTSVEKALDYASARDPNAVRKALGGIFQAGSPARGDMIAATNAFKPLVENMTNYSFFKSQWPFGARQPLVSQAQQQLSPAMQFGPGTSETAKFVGKKLNQSPIMIDNLIQGYFGGLGRYGTNITDWVLLKAQGADTPAPPAKSITQYPLIKGFVKQPYEQSAYVQRFYAGLDRAETRLNDLRAYSAQLDTPGMRDFLKNNRNEVAWYNAGHGEGTLMTELRKTRDDLSDINKAIVAVQQSRTINPEEKSKRLIRLGEMRDKLAEAAFKTYIHPSDREKVF